MKYNTPKLTYSINNYIIASIMYIELSCHGTCPHLDSSGNRPCAEKVAHGTYFCEWGIKNRVAPLNPNQVTLETKGRNKVIARVEGVAINEIVNGLMGK